MYNFDKNKKEYGAKMRESNISLRKEHTSLFRNLRVKAYFQSGLAMPARNYKLSELCFLSSLLSGSVLLWQESSH